MNGVVIYMPSPMGYRGLSNQYGEGFKYNVQRMGPFVLDLNLVAVGGAGEIIYPSVLLKNEAASGRLTVTDTLIHIMDGGIAASISLFIWDTTGKILGVDVPQRVNRIFSTTLTVDQNAIPSAGPNEYNYETVHIQCPITLNPGEWLMGICSQSDNCNITAHYAEEI